MAVLGLAFNWGALVGYAAATGILSLPVVLLYAGGIAWTLGYDTIYAHQDREDDALVGIRSSALRLGAHVRGGVALFYAVAMSLWALAFWLLRPDWLALLALERDAEPPEHGPTRGFRRTPDLPRDDGGTGGDQMGFGLVRMCLNQAVGGGEEAFALRLEDVEPVGDADELELAGAAGANLLLVPRTRLAWNRLH